MKGLDFEVKQNDTIPGKTSYFIGPRDSKHK
jgi:hypothetical protein